jgi:hypothetical protein
MLSSLDQIIFPNVCEVLEIVPQQRYVYPIFKNGSTSLKRHGYRLISDQELATVKEVDVFVRNPYERFLTGVNTYFQRLDPALDKTTAMFFVKNFLFLNRHFSPQLYWIINFRRFSNAKFNIRPMSDIETVTTFKENTSIIDPDIREYFDYSGKIRFLLEMDEILTVNLIGQTVEFDEIISVLKQNYQEIYQEVFLYSQRVLNVVS